MRLEKFLKQVADLFDAKKRKCKKEKECLLYALKRLKKREEVLEDKLERQESGKARKRLKDDLKVTKAQRRKGTKMLKELESS